MRKFILLLVLFGLCLSCLIFFGAKKTQATDPSRVLVVYKINSTDSDGDGIGDSQQLANYYALKRGIPESNLLGLNITVTHNYYYTGEYPKFFSDIISPIKDKLQSLGSTNIDIIMVSGKLPSIVYDPSSNKRSVDNVLMALNLLTADTLSFVTYTNPYLEKNPTFDTDKGHFDHSLYRVNGADIYIVTRLGSESDLQGIDQLDQCLYAEKFLYRQSVYYFGNAY
ncbi:MAG: hypothetical protein PHI86_07835, partial [Candidatus Omnitrophica bacterium]|nr:hypothetical protein [Candidatus Omnitrophota bacterium]